MKGVVKLLGGIATAVFALLEEFILEDYSFSI
jgi:hypothetical protein